MTRDLAVLSIREMLKQLDDAIAWLQSKGEVKTLSSSRVGEWKRELNALLDCAENGDLKKYDEPGGLASLATSLNEASELHDIYTGLGAIEDDDLDARVRRLIKGPFQPTEERPGSGSHLGRDTAFELNILSRFVRAGYTADPSSDSDAHVRLPDGRSLFVQCKRPQSKKRISKLFRAARDQLLADFTRTESSRDCRGLIALGISKVFVPFPALLAVQDRKNLGEALHAAVNGFASEHRDVWKQAQAGSYRKVVGALVFLGVPAFVESEGLPLSCRQFLLVPLSKKQSDIELSRAIVNDLAAE